MKHAVVGTGTIGSAWALWLSINEKDVAVYDIDKEAAERTGCRVVDMQTIKEEAEIIWICTAEWHLDAVLEQLRDTDKKVVIRSTIPPSYLHNFEKIYNIKHMAHMPEFIREKTAVQDMFNQDRFVIGTTDDALFITLHHMLQKTGKPIFWVTPQASSLIKLIANNWLATQISFWNEIKKILDTQPQVDNEQVVNAVTADKRIATYGSHLTGEPFQGFCLPKDLNMMLEEFARHDKQSPLLTAVKQVNEAAKEE
jgi:nucleotide sugar dehydrogenase